MVEMISDSRKLSLAYSIDVLSYLSPNYIRNFYPNIKGTLQSKLVLGFLAGKSMYFWKNFTMKTIWIDAVVT